MRAVQDLNDRYRLNDGEVYLTGLQALVKLMLLQRQRDVAAGLNTAGFVSGYRGSPLGAVDQQFWRAQRFLERAPIHFQPGVNEDLAATAIWGTQQVNLYPGARYDGVFSLWYGKGPGVDRSGDVFKHANAAGTSRHGGVLLAAGDDHAAKSSTYPHQSEYAFVDAMIPVLNPSGVQDVIDYGLFGFALSRFSGCWVALKIISETADSSATVDIDPGRLKLIAPEFEVPGDGLNIRWPDTPLDQEYRLHRYRIYAALAFARANSINRVVLDSPEPRLGIVTTGKSYLDVRQALDDLGIDEELAAQIGLRIYKVGMTWPLEAEGVRAFASGLEEILVVEEKRAVIENQLKEQLYHWNEAVRPRVVGKFDEQRQWLLPSTGELTPAAIARVLAARIGRFFDSELIEKRLAFLSDKEDTLAVIQPAVERTPHFCSGCPHNTSTKVPEGSRATAGIGCHYMVQWMDRDTTTFTQMGGEGAPWIGQAPFTETEHVFQNLGDGTYYHSGLLAIRAALAAKVNITYKILYNDAVAMTGGQPVDGALTVPMITRQLAGEGVVRQVVVADDPERYDDVSDLAPGVSVHHRRELMTIQRELREVTGVSILIYDQTCAAEKRRRRKRGLMEDPARRVVINSDVCEGCGDCSRVSNCLSVVPVETEFGRKRTINQSACNKDFSCVEGFCPSFVSVVGGQLRRTQAAVPQLDHLPLEEPEWDPKRLDTPFNIVIPGVGGTGVVTISALLAMAAHVDGKAALTLDQTGLAQKFGAVLSHVRLANTPDVLHTVRVPAGEADLLLGCDLMVAAGKESLGKLDVTRSAAVINTYEDMPAAFIANRDLKFPAVELRQTLKKTVRGDAIHWVPATKLATRLLGDAIASNLFLLGYAYQLGHLPISAKALERAVELNGVAIEQNINAFRLGRHAAVDINRVEVPVSGNETDEGVRVSNSLAEVIERRTQALVEYQNEDYARKYADLVARVQSAEQQVDGSSRTLSEAVARNLYKLMAYKDEYEVARMLSSEAFRRRLDSEFEGNFKLKFHLAPPLLTKVDPATGRPMKRIFGGWLMPLFSLLSKLKFLRGKALDPFGHAAERRMERELRDDYVERIQSLLPALNAQNLAVATAIAALPDIVRGYGPVKAQAVSHYREQLAELEGRWRSPSLDRAA